jgi:hypothetical protein
MARSLLSCLALKEKHLELGRTNRPGWGLVDMAYSDGLGVDIN